MDLENNTPTAEAEMSPADLFLKDLTADEVSSQSENQSSEETTPAENEPTAPAEQRAEQPMQAEQPSNITDNADQRNAFLERLGQLSEAAKAREAQDAQQAEQPVAEQPQEPVEEPVDEQALLNKFYDNPLEAINEIADRKAAQIVRQQIGAIKDELDPLIQQSNDIKYQNNVRDILTNFVNQRPDSQEMLDDMVKYVIENDLPRNDERSYADAYRESKIARQNGIIDQLRQSQGRTLDDYLGDQDSINKIAGNEAVQKLIIENYLKGLQNGARPATITNSGTAVPVAQPANRPMSFAEAGNMFKADLNR